MAPTTQAIMKTLAPRHPLPRSAQVDRDQYLLDLCSGQRVVHLACAAWPATQAWCEDGTLLHLRLARVCKELAGFDWSEPGLKVLEDHGVSGLQRLNLLDAEQVARGWNKLPFSPDIVLAGELLEHLDRAGTMLENCRRCMPQSSRLVITVPNAFSLRSILHVWRGYEKVASDHVGYYSFSTLRELVERNGFGVLKTNWYRYSPQRKPIDRALDLVLRPMLQLWPQFSEGLIAECTPSGESVMKTVTK